MKNEGVSSGSKGKVAQLIEKHELDGVGGELEANWTAEDNRMSLRELTMYFNKKLLRTALDDRGVTTLDGEIDNYYELLTNDEITSGVRTQAENRLEEYGIDINQLRTDFVSRQAIHTYLKQRGAEYKTSGQDENEPVTRRLEELQRLKSRQTAVTKQTLSTLQNSDHITLGEFQTLVSIRIQCTDCGSQFDVAELLDRGGCDCATS